MRVLVLAQGFNPRLADNGYSRHVSEFSRALAKVPGIEVVVLSLGDESLDEVLGGCRYRVLRRMKWFRIAPLVPVLWLAFEIRRIRPDIIHVEGSAFDHSLICSLFFAPSTCRRCVTIHGHPAHEGVVNRRFREGGLMYALNLLGERALAGKFDAVICVSERRRAEILAAKTVDGRADVFMVPNGIDAAVALRCESLRLRLTSQEKWNRAGPRIVQVKSLVPYSGQDVLIRAFGTVSSKMPGSRLILAGDGWYKPALEALALQIGVRHNVDFLGKVDNSAVPAIVFDCNVAVMPSNPIGGVEEGSSIALLEYMSCCVPVVASDVGGNREAIVDGTTGILVHPGDSDALAMAILDLWSNPQKSERLAVNAHDYVLNNRIWSKIAGDYVEIYRTLMGGG